jgi:hypothetical protein
VETSPTERLDDLVTPVGISEVWMSPAAAVLTRIPS